MIDHERQIGDFLSVHIPAGTEEYAPEGSDEAQPGAALAEHFNKLADEEMVLLGKLSNVRFR